MMSEKLLDVLEYDDVDADRVLIRVSSYDI